MINQFRLLFSLHTDGYTRYGGLHSPHDIRGYVHYVWCQELGVSCGATPSNSPSLFFTTSGISSLRNIYEYSPPLPLYFCFVLPLGFSDDDIERKAADASRELASKRARLKAEIQMLQQHLGGSAEGAEKAKGIQAIKMKSSLSKKQAALADLSNEGGGSGSGGGRGGGRGGGGAAVGGAEDAIGWGSHGGGITQRGLKVDRKFRTCPPPLLRIT